MKKKVSFLAVLTLALAASVTAAAAALVTPEVSVPPVVSQDGETTQPIEIQPYTIDKTWSDIAKSAPGRSDATNSFTVNSGNGHLKLLIKNVSAFPVTVTLTHSDTSLVYFTLVIPANSSKEWYNFPVSGAEGGQYPQGMRLGDYKLQWVGKDHPVDGIVYGKLASSTTDF